MRKTLSIFAILAMATSAWAEDEETEEEEGKEGKDGAKEGEDEGKVEEDPDEKPTKAKPVVPFRKQNITGHAAADDTKVNAANLFERDRFYVDKNDSEKSAKRTLIQGSLTSTLFAHREVGGTIPNTTNVPSNSPFTRAFTDLRLQTDFRHIGGGRWDARVDTRGRFALDPGSQTAGYVPADNSSSQSGFLGDNELEIKELWIARSGKRTDLFFGRQFIADLGGVKFDGLRFDYAKSSKFTLLGFSGLYPIRGSRSITTDYEPLKSAPDPMTGLRADAGRYTGTGGFGAAYRTANAYGAFGGVAIAPLSSEAPRVYGTSTGYWRFGPKVDIYHFGIIDLLGDQAGITNLSAGVNFKPDQRLRGTVSINRVDTETLNVHAQAFLNDPDRAFANVQNEAFLIRIAQNAARASVSAGLGSLQRFEITVATTFRYRGELTLVAQGNEVVGGVPQPPPTFTLPAGKSVEVYGSITDRRSFKQLRIGVDGSRLFRVGDANYQRTTATSLRTYVARELKSGRGEWEAELGYSTSKDDQVGTACVSTSLVTCYGAAASKVLSLGGNLYYRINRDWFAMGSAFLNRYAITSTNGMTIEKDPAVLGISGFARIAYRF